MDDRKQAQEGACPERNPKSRGQNTHHHQKVKFGLLRITFSFLKQAYFSLLSRRSDDKKDTTFLRVIVLAHKGLLGSPWLRRGFGS